jgi:hypothetical protein
MNSGDYPAIRDLPGPFQQIVAFCGKQYSEDTRLKFRARRVAAGRTKWDSVAFSWRNFNAQKSQRPFLT